MNNKVLILGVSAVQLDAIKELKTMGYETYTCAMAKDGPGADYSDHFKDINILDNDGIINYIKENRICAVYSVGSDLAVPMACHISEQLYLPHFVSEKTARICNNKDLMRTTLGNEFLGNVKFQVMKSEEEKPRLGFPLILKPADSQGQRGIKQINSYEEYLPNYRIAKQYSRSGLVMIEQLISGPELSVNGYLVNGDIKFFVVSDRVTWPEYTGLIHKHIIPSSKLTHTSEIKLMHMIKSACEKLKIVNGPVYAQIKLESGIPYIIEITPRLDGCHMWNILNRYSGVNLLRLTFEDLLNNDRSELDKQYQRYGDGYVLEFLCQEPNTCADYSVSILKTEQSLESFNYYKQGDNIRPVNGKYDKIGYVIYKK